MAKKRVHEIAKERGIPSKEVIAKLQAAGLNVKAAASSVDEADIELAFSGGKKAPPEPDAKAGNGAAAWGRPAPREPQATRPPAPANPTRPTRPTRDGGGAGAGGR